MTTTNAAVFPVDAASIRVDDHRDGAIWCAKAKIWVWQLVGGALSAQFDANGTLWLTVEGQAFRVGGADSVVRRIDPIRWVT